LRSDAARAGTLHVADAAPLFAALGDETRLRLVARLAKTGPGSIARLSERADVTRQAITKHLEVLADAGLVTSHKQGRERVWQLEPKRLADAHHHLDAISKQWDVALDRLKHLVEGD
jgi:DNA-binding transcriptional ArsR family regulator